MLEEPLSLKCIPAKIYECFAVIGLHKSHEPRIKTLSSILQFECVRVGWMEGFKGARWLYFSIDRSLWVDGDSVILPATLFILQLYRFEKDLLTTLWIRLRERTVQLFKYL